MKHNQQWHKQYNDAQVAQPSKAENWNAKYNCNITVSLTSYNLLLYKQLENKEKNGNIPTSS